jgi:hypothetical protein
MQLIATGESLIKTKEDEAVEKNHDPLLKE